MRISLVIACEDKEYIECINDVLMEKYPNEFDIRICLSKRSFIELMDKGQKIDVVLVDETIVESHIDKNIFILTEDRTKEEGYIYKYQRVTKIVSELLAYCSTVKQSISTKTGGVTVSWSPCGGTGKTTVALAYAVRKTLQSHNATYLNLEDFSSIGTYFCDSGKSISSAFEKLDSSDVSMMLRSIQQVDSATGISYYGIPNNYDDMNILTEDDVIKIIEGCQKNSDEVIVDLSSVYNAKVAKILLKADKILLVVDGSNNAKNKVQQFFDQHNIWAKIQHKSVIINNKGGNYQYNANIIKLPFVQSTDPINIYKTLSSESF